VFEAYEKVASTRDCNRPSGVGARCGPVDGDPLAMSKHDDDSAARGGSARYTQGGHATGSNEPKEGERKEQREDWVHRQGGDQTRDGDPHADDSREAGAES
jgi:hypothetical protein